jgi:long-chain acyl-CoA synthetase
VGDGTERTGASADTRTAAPRGPVVVASHELEAAGNRFARALDDAGVPRRGSVAVLAGNTLEYLAAYRGAIWSGRRFTPISWRWPADDVAYVVGNCEADALVVDARFAEAAHGAARIVDPDRRLAAGGPIPGFRDWSEVEAESGDPLDEPVAGTTMLYTSGTTGRPKGVRRDFPEGPPPGHLGLGGVQMLRWCLGDEAGDRAHLVTTPMYHSGPLTYADGASLLGADLVLLDRFEPETVLRTIEEHRVSSTFMVPTQFVRLMRLPGEVRERHDLSSLQLVVHGSAPVAPEVKRAMIDWLGPVLFEFYGGTEGGGVSIDSHDWLTHPGSVGRPRVGLQVEVRDDAGAAEPAGVEGQVWFHDGRAFEYKDDADKTAEAVRDGWFTIGDIGYLDDEGYLYLCDRRADVVVSGGVNVYPAQVEAALLAHRAVVDCCVVGVPDDEWGESLTAVVTAAPGHEPGAELTEELLAHCRRSLAGYQVPRHIDFDEELPRTETGKLARRVVRERYWAGRSRRI